MQKPVVTGDYLRLGRACATSLKNSATSDPYILRYSYPVSRSSVSSEVHF
jgi:hypothetical protein